ncbi:MAG: deoxyribose-phosphate aldolase, partial [Nitrospinae bacterium]|nr:deoxyribose-phosphate aldolase [Nitrospinota bacterium]
MADLAKLIDHTLLKPETTREDIANLCSEAKRYGFYSVCIPPFYVALAKRLLQDTGIKICTVVGFPLGFNTPHIKVIESRNAAARGADELDIVINVGLIKSKEDSTILEELKRIIKVTPKSLHKVIIETPLLTDREKERAALLVAESGAEFVKTSTGFISGPTSIEDVLLLYKTVGNRRKIKAAGGIRDLKGLKDMV